MGKLILFHGYMTGPDPAFKQLHLYVCIMIELRNYNQTDKVQAVFELCKVALQEHVVDFPIAQSVVERYVSCSTPEDMTLELCRTNYTDQYVNDVNDIITEIMLSEDPEKLMESFQALTKLYD